MRTIAYNRAAVLDYARRWAFSRNPEYYNFDNLGGDCTNFASQCIYTGSGQMNYTPDFGWYYISLTNRAAAWTGVTFLYNFLTKNEGLGPFATETDASDIRIGDIIQLGREDGSFYHSLIVTSIFPEILVAAHTNDAFNRTLRTYTYYTARYLHIEGVRIP